MLWDLFGEEAAKFFRCWNTCTKLCWELPRNTPVYFVDHILSCGFPSIRQQVLSRYIKFYRSLLTSPSKEVAVIARIVGKDASTNTGSNLLNISLETKLDVRLAPLSKFMKNLYKPAAIPVGSEWKLSLLEKYIRIRDEQLLACEDTSYIVGLITSLCST